MLTLGFALSHNCHHHRWKEDTLPPMHTIKLLFEAVYRVVSKEPVLLEVSPSPVYIIGDIHGNYHVCFLGISLFTFLLTSLCIATQDLHQFLDIFGLLRCGAFVPAKFLFLGGLYPC